MKRDERGTFTFQHTGSDKPEPGMLQFLFTSEDGQRKSNKTLHEIDYPHIMPQVYYTPAEVKMIPLEVKTTAKTVGYIKGAGDEVPQAIEQLGVKVTAQRRLAEIPINPVVFKNVRLETAMNLLLRQWPLAGFVWELQADRILIREN